MVEKTNLAYVEPHTAVIKDKIVMFAMAKLMEMETTEQNKVALYLFNEIDEKK